MRRNRHLARPASRAPREVAGQPVRISVKAPKGWVVSTVAGIALTGITGTAMLAYEEVPTSLPITDAQGRAQKVGQAGLNLIEQFEGLELTGYVLGDGMCTIGYGHAIPIAEKPAAECKSWTITNAQAEEFLRQDVQRFGDNINDYFCRSFNQNQFDALVSFSYNVGYAYEKYEWDCNAPDTYFPGVMIQYVNPPQFREGLTKRRKAEIALFENPNGPAAAVDTNSAPAEPAPQPSVTEPAPAAPAPEPAPEPEPAPAPAPQQADVPTVVVTMFPEIAPLISGGLSAR